MQNEMKHTRKNTAAHTHAEIACVASYYPCVHVSQILSTPNTNLCTSIVVVLVAMSCGQYLFPPIRHRKHDEASTKHAKLPAYTKFH
mmetsp:Transcript_20746/g.31716  ORF Transcript_20746/g.31716 Transcript_20746/m.31716 type:complete len:87 (+) Transcript_20746:113-373(+)